MKTLRAFYAAAVIALLFSGCGGSSGSGGANYPRFEGGDNELLQFKFPSSKNAGLSADISGEISGELISATVPAGTSPRTLVAEFVSNSTSVKVNGVLQKSGETPNDFSAPVTYHVYSDTGIEKKYIVTVTVAPGTEKRFTSFSLNGTAGVIDEASSSIAVELPPGADLKNLTASYGALCKTVEVNGVVQENGVTVNNFSAPVVYTLIAEDRGTRTYVVTARVLPAPWKDITAFSFRTADNSGLESDAAGLIEGDLINVVLPHGTDPGDLAASFTITGKKVLVDGKVQISGETRNDYSRPLEYRVTAEDGSEKSYTVKVTVAKSGAKSITRFALDGETSLIDESAGAIKVAFPPSKNLRGLIASFVTTGVLVTVNGEEQAGGVTSNDYSGPVVYDVVAEDGTVKSYTVRAEKTEGLAALWNFENPSDEYTVFEAREADGILGGALLFDGYNDYVLVPDSDLLTLADAGSVETVVKIVSHKPFAGIVHKGTRKDFSDESYSLQFWGKNGTDGTVRFSIFNESGAYEYVESGTKLELEKWYHIVAAWNETEIALYINGALEASIPNTVGKVRDSAGGLVIGAQLADIWYNSSWRNLGMYGIVDRVELYTGALKADEVKAKYRALFPEEGGSMAAYLLGAAARNAGPVLPALIIVALALAGLFIYHRRRAIKGE